MKKCLFRFCAMVVAICIMCTSAGAISSIQENIVEHEDGSYTEIRTTVNDITTINEFDAVGNTVSTSTVRTSGDVNIAIFDNGEDVYKSVFNTETYATQIFTKKSDEPDSAFRLYYEITAQELEAKREEQLELYAGVAVETYKTKCYQYKYYLYSDGAHALWMGNEMAGAFPNTFVSECKAFKSHAQDCDNYTLSLAKDMFGMIPVGDILITCGDILYNAAIKKDSSAVVADILYDYVLSVAKTVCKPAAAIAAIIDGVSLLYNLRQVRKNFDIVHAGQKY